jgi:CspA family cold shock protein
MNDTGTVKWFDAKKGYGFITPSNGDKDLFVHHTSLQMDGFKTLNEAQTVTYEVAASDKGDIATNVTPQQ